MSVIRENFPQGQTPVDPNRRLLNGIIAAALGAQEIYVPDEGGHIITLPSSSPEIEKHNQLLERRLPVFSAMYQPTGELHISVPRGTRLLSKVLRFVARDIANYEEIFFRLGDTLRQIDTANEGMPVARLGRLTLDQFAFSQEEDDIYGGNLYLVPPYTLDKNSTSDGALESITHELLASEQFEVDEVAELQATILKGWEDGSSRV